MSTAVETKVVSIVERLRKLADVCERHEIELSYATVQKTRLAFTMLILFGFSKAKNFRLLVEVDLILLMFSQSFTGSRSTVRCGVLFRVLVAQIRLLSNHERHMDGTC